MGIQRSCTLNHRPLLAALIALAVPTFGTAAQRCETHSLKTQSTINWNAPLARRISVRARDVTLPVALDRIAQAAGLRFSYSADLLPDRRVCINYESVAIGAALADLLRGLPIEPRILSLDHVVLAQAVAAPVQVVLLDPIFATAASIDPQYDDAPYGLSVLQRSDLEHMSTIEQALNAGVPGMWAWQSPGGMTAQYSVRGASSFSATAPKVYIDGIEVANSMLVTRLSPDNIERIEFIRGPEGAALYGADAMSGVTNIVTRHDALEDGMPRLLVRSGLALSATTYAGVAAVAQDHSAALRLGAAGRSLALNAGVGASGEYTPGASGRYVNVDASTRLVGARLLFATMARFAAQTAGNPSGIPMAMSGMVDPTRVSMQQFTTGMRTVFRQSERFTHTLVAGLDGYNLNGASGDSAMIRTATDSVLRAAGDRGLRSTLRISSTARFKLGDISDQSLTLAAEHTALKQYGIAADVAGLIWPLGAPTSSGEPAPNHQPVPGPLYSLIPGEESVLLHSEIDLVRHSKSISAQLDASIRERFQLVGALRVEHGDIVGTRQATVLLPMFGASHIAQLGNVSLRTHASYGRGVRWPMGLSIPSEWYFLQVRKSTLQPEQQHGYEAGVDVGIGRSLGFEVTRYEQISSGLIQAVPFATLLPRPRYKLQNVGEIANRGWEMRAFAQRGAWVVNGTMALVDSRVEQVAPQYAGDLRAGDRMLAVPARTASVDATYRARKWSTTLFMARAFDWFNYDKVALIEQDSDLSGEELRTFWRHYSGHTHMRAVYSRQLENGFTVLVTANNLLNRRKGEPDNLTVMPGRTVSLGVRAAF